ncbi:DUF2292 domain-containing protein [Brevibacillus brevis]|uniref:DUF2292 domain-containing protein n=1 Tax=Brevibacillus brevis TaxID=1393 RepID=UPI000D109D6B|nr:DUF2292 domain-containing protein [Brevibacillus brevis]PSJ67719.1 hypothetical protein C7J99_19370 [Brevibacillus brevis]GEC90566.1 hypothetical protein BBR01nite_28970 [Brevibacillus brevis]
MSVIINRPPAVADEREILLSKIEPKVIQSLADFLHNARFGSFTLIVHENKVIGYDQMIKNRI